MKRRCGKFLVLFPLMVALLAGVLTLIVQSLWNGVLTEVVGVRMITYWQALGLLVLARILVGGFPKPGGGRFGPRGRHMMMEHWESLTPEQREKLRAGMGQRCGWGPWREPQGAGPSAETGGDQLKTGSGTST